MWDKAFGPIAALVVLVTGCSAIRPATATDDLAEAFLAAGLEVEPAGTIRQPFFSVPARVFVVNGDDVQVYEYPSTDGLERDAANVATDARSVGTTHVHWLAPPHVYKTDRLLVIWLGSQEAVAQVLESKLGPPFAGEGSGQR